MEHSRETFSTLVYRVNKRLKQGLQEKLRDYDITTDQWIILRKIALDSGKYNQRELADSCFKERAAITRMIDLMEKKQLIYRSTSLADRREYLLYITDEGRSLYESTLERVSSEYDAIYEVLSKDEVEEAITLLEKLERGLADL